MSLFQLVDKERAFSRLLALNVLVRPVQEFSKRFESRDGTEHTLCSLGTVKWIHSNSFSHHEASAFSLSGHQFRG